jgi:PmbA protein
MFEQEFKYIFDYARDKVEDIEVILSEVNSFSSRIHQQKVEAFNYSDSKGIGIRVIINGKAGYSYTEKFDEESYRMAVDEAKENALVCEDDDIVIMENYPQNSELKTFYSEDLDRVDVSEKIKLAMSLEKYAKEADKRVFNVPYAMFGDSRAYVKIANSKGLDKEEKQNNSYCFVGALSQEKEDKRIGIDFFVGRDFCKIDPKKMAETCVRKSTALLGGKDILPGVYSVVFDNDMMATLLGTFSTVFYANIVQEGKSLLKGKLGQIIANEKINIIDDALHPEGIASRNFDSEGYPSQRTVLVEKGKLISYLHNTKTAYKDKVSSTGNGSRSYKGSLNVSATNLILAAGDHAKKELLSSGKQIIEIVSLQGMHSGANPISGDFSLSAEGFFYENGKKQHSLKQFTVSGNFLKLLQNVEMIANDFRFNSSAVGAASVLVKEMSISG